MTQYKYLFGPVPSRRFGRSLGVDLTPFKTCSLNCIFCQLGRTTTLTIERREYVPTRDVVAELAQWLDRRIPADYLTLSGSGEPTLHTGFGHVLRYARAKTGIRTALLTNGTTLYLPEVRAAARNAHVIKASLSAWDQDSFERLHLPPAAVTFDRVVAGERAMRAEHDGEMWLEVMLVAGQNAEPEQVRRIAAIANDIGFDRIHLNTVVRPPAAGHAAAVPRPQLEELARLFRPEAEILADYRGEPASGTGAGVDAILDVIRRRPCTAAQIARVLGLHPNEVSKHLAALAASGSIQPEEREGQVYYVCRR